ncbi:MAG: hypothetical protein ACKOA8_11575, partial [Deltaproteobacteria bacterium]
KRIDRKSNLEFKLRILPAQKKVPIRKLKRRCYVENIWVWNLVRAYPFHKNQAVVYYPPKKKTHSPTLYHQFFLDPVSQMLRSHGASFIHAAVLSWKGKGVVLLGPKGAGKSSLSAALIELGFKYYGDEHPILSLEKGKVWGKSFPSAIALDRNSKNYFHLWESKMNWHPHRGKFLLDPRKIKSNSIGKRCLVQTVIFLNPNEKAEYRVTPVPSLKAYGKLLEDYYLAVGDEPLLSKESIAHLDLVAKLVEQSRSVQLSYGGKKFREVARVIQRELIDYPSKRRAA